MLPLEIISRPSVVTHTVSRRAEVIQSLGFVVVVEVLLHSLYIVSLRVVLLQT